MGKLELDLEDELRLLRLLLFVEEVGSSLHSELSGFVEVGKLDSDSEDELLLLLEESGSFISFLLFWF